MTTEVIPRGGVESAQTFPQPDIGHAIDVLASNPMRSLLFLASVRSGGLLTPGEYGTQLNALQRDQPGQVFNASNYSLVRRNCDHLSAAGFMEGEEKLGERGKPVPSFRAHPQLPPCAEAVAGTLLDWELQFPEDTLATALGDKRMDVPVGTPTISLRVYRHLLNREDGFDSATGLQAVNERGRRGFETLLQKLHSRGMLLRDERAPIAGRSLSLQQPSMRHGRYLDQMTGVARAMYLAAMRLLREGTTSISVSGLAAVIAEQHPQYSTEDIARRLDVRMPSYMAYEDQGRYGANPNAGTRYEIAPEKQEALADLVLRTAALANPTFRERAVRRAYKILDSPDDVAFLFAKSRERRHPADLQPGNSTAANRRRLGSLTLRPLVVENGWQRRAACDGTDSDLFFPIGARGPSAAQTESAKTICRSCPVTASCLQWSIDTGQQHGIFGGMTPDERRAYRSGKARGYAPVAASTSQTVSNVRLVKHIQQAISGTAKAA